MRTALRGPGYLTTLPTTLQTNTPFFVMTVIMLRQGKIMAAESSFLTKSFCAVRRSDLELYSECLSVLVYWNFWHVIFLHPTRRLATAEENCVSSLMGQYCKFLTDKYVVTATRQFLSRMSAGWDSIPCFIVKGCCVVFAPLLCHILRMSLVEQHFPISSRLEFRRYLHFAQVRKSHYPRKQ